MIRLKATYLHCMCRSNSSCGKIRQPYKTIKNKMQRVYFFVSFCVVHTNIALLYVDDSYTHGSIVYPTTLHAGACKFRQNLNRKSYDNALHKQTSFVAEA